MWIVTKWHDWGDGERQRMFLDSRSGYPWTFSPSRAFPFLRREAAEYFADLHGGTVE